MWSRNLMRQNKTLNHHLGFCKTWKHKTWHCGGLGRRVPIHKLIWQWHISEFFWADRHKHRTHESATPVYLSLHYQKLFFVDNFLKIHIFKENICMAISLRLLRSDLILKNTAISTEGITRSSVNYLRKRKREYSRDVFRS